MLSRRLQTLIAAAVIFVLLAAIVAVLNMFSWTVPPAIEVPPDEVEVAAAEVREDDEFYRSVSSPVPEAEAMERLRLYLGLPQGTRIMLSTFRSGGRFLLRKTERGYDPDRELLMGSIAIPGGNHPVALDVKYPPDGTYRLGRHLTIKQPRQNRLFIAKAAEALSRYRDQTAVDVTPLVSTDKQVPQEILRTTSGDPLSGPEIARLYVITPGHKVPTKELLVLGSWGSKHEDVFAVDYTTKTLHAFRLTPDGAVERKVKSVSVDPTGRVRATLDGVDHLDIPGAAERQAGKRIVVNGIEQGK